MMMAMAITAFCVILSVSLHLVVLLILWRHLMPRIERYWRLAPGIMVLGAIVAHILEIFLFGIAIYLVASPDERFRFVDELEIGKPGIWYVSAASFTSLGTDPLPSATLRLVTSVEAVTGLVLITWTASFVLIVMQKNWPERIP